MCHLYTGRYIARTNSLLSLPASNFRRFTNVGNYGNSIASFSNIGDESREVSYS